MKITRLKLVNFIGIKNGLGKDEIEIVFPNNNKIITMFVGKNGSGKSTIMSQLTPFKDSFDDRKNLILPDKEGIKEIDIENDSHIYKIKHVYGKISSSFISEDGVELNENGGVRTFEDIILQKFKLSKEYFKIGKVGSNTTNFIQFTTTQRKIYISTFVEAVQKFLDSFDIVSKKSKFYENQIKQIGNDLKKFGESETITAQINENENNLKTTEAAITESTQASIKLNVEIDDLRNKISDYNYAERKELLNEKKKTWKNNQILTETFKSLQISYSEEDLAKEIEKETLSEQTITNELNDKNIELATLNSNKINADNNIIKAQSQLSDKEAVDLTSLKESIDKYNNVKTLFDKKLSENKLLQYIKDNENKIPVFIDSFKNFMSAIISDYSVLVDYNIEKNIRNIDVVFADDFDTLFGNYIININNALASNRALLESTLQEQSAKSANLSQLDILNKRPAECSIDICPFISNALKYRNLPEELEKLDKKVTELKSNIDVEEKELEKTNDLKIVFSNVRKMYGSLLPRENLIYQVFTKKYGSIYDFTKLTKNDLEKAFYDMVSLIEKYLSHVLKYNTMCNKLSVDEIKYAKYEESEKNRLYFESELKKLKEDNETNNNSIKLCSAKINELSAELSKVTERKTNLINYQNSLKENKTLDQEILLLENELSIYENNSKSLNNKSNEKNVIDDKITNLISIKNNINGKLTSLRAAELTVNNLKENMKSVTESFNDVDLVKDALNPKSGIPLIFIQSYLDSTEFIANELLNIAYNGKFEIKFVPTSTDFFIQVRSGNNIIEDIKLASQGEIALTTISISLALIERALGKFNILYLDEIDGPLDSDNRKSFIDILNKQIEKLNLEQIFVISHNNAFENCEMNLVLLEGNNINKDDQVFMNNKEIIFDADSL